MNADPQPQVIEYARRPQNAGRSYVGAAGLVSSLLGLLSFAILVLIGNRGGVAFALLGLLAVFSALGFALSVSALRKRPRALAIVGISLATAGLMATAAALTGPRINTPSPAARVMLTRASIGPNGPIARALKFYKHDVGTFPDDLAVLCVRPSNAAQASKWLGPYLEDVQGLRDPWGRPYRYTYVGVHNKDAFDLWSVGADGIDGTADDIANWP